MVAIFTNGDKIRVSINNMEGYMSLFENKQRLKPLVDGENITTDKNNVE